VNRPVNFGDQAFFRAEEVHDKWADRLLATELATIKLLAAQCVP
jgi:hypothetical protein